MPKNYAGVLKHESYIDADAHEVLLKSILPFSLYMKKAFLNKNFDNQQQRSQACYVINS